MLLKISREKEEFLFHNLQHHFIYNHQTILVARWFIQHPGIEFNETFAPTAQMDIVIIVLSIATHNKWPIHQMDVKFYFFKCLSGGGSVCRTTTRLGGSSTRKQSLQIEEINIWFEVGS